MNDLSDFKLEIIAIRSSIVRGGYFFSPFLSPPQLVSARKLPIIHW